MHNNKLNILIVEDDDLDQLLIKRELKKSDLDFAVLCVDNRSDFITQLTAFRPDIILCDYSIPQFGALEALKILGGRSSQIPVIIVTGALTDELAVECLKNGAIDYVLKDKIVRLPSAIRLALDLVNSKKEKMNAEIRLSSSEKQLKIITDVLPASLTYISNKLQFEFSNKVNEEWFGRNIVGEPIEDVLGAIVAQKIRTEIASLTSGKKLSFESLLSGNSANRFINIILVPDYENVTLLKGFVCLITDVTDRKIYENELKDAKDAADTANSAKSQFLANMSHEIRTPLNVIMGLSELLISDPDAEPTERTLWLKKIVRNSEHLKKVIDEILDISKIEAGKVQLQVTRFSINEMIAQLKSILWPLAREKNLEIKFETLGAVPEFINSDAVKLRHILLNLLDNAIKFSSKGPILFQAKIEYDGGHPRYLFMVKDQGIGMSADQAVHLFEPFTQVDNSMTRRFGGTGLGLALAKQLARALGGDVALKESAPGVGSTFIVSIDPGPIEDSPKISSFELFATVPEQIQVAAAVKPIANMRVLVVEDSVDNQLYIKTFLKKEGVLVEVANDGQEGVKKALHGLFDLILMDIQMPVMDGYTATSRLRKNGYDKPILAFTAHSLQNERERYLKAGFNGFISKPVHKAELIKCLAEFNKSSTIKSNQPEM